MNRNEAIKILEMARAIKIKAIRAYFLGGPMIRTEDAYFRQVWRLIRDLYSGDIDEFTYIDDFSQVMENQFTRAWNQGAREMGKDPRTFTDEDLQYLRQRVNDEVIHSLGLVDDVLKAKQEGTGVAQFRTRVESYAARYNDMVSEARMQFGAGNLLEWRYGQTEHCDDCTMLNGIVASADEWKLSGWKPQGQDLQCGGYHCRCGLYPTDKAPTPGGIPGRKG